MELTWLGTATLMIESGEYKILFDPYLRTLNKNLPPFRFDKIADADAIFITHPHLDHYADIPEIMRHTTCPVYTNSRGVEIAKSRGFDLSRIKKIDFDDEFTFGDIELRACRGRHVQFDRACVKSAIKRTLHGNVRDGIKIKNENKHFKIDLSDIFTYYLRAGDTTALILGSANKDAQASYPVADILVYPYQGRSDMLEYSIKLIKSFSPKTVIADHFDDAFPPVSTQMNVEELKNKLESESDIKVIIPTEYVPIRL